MTTNLQEEEADEEEVVATDFFFHSWLNTQPWHRHR